MLGSIIVYILVSFLGPGLLSIHFFDFAVIPIINDIKILVDSHISQAALVYY